MHGLAFSQHEDLKQFQLRKGGKRCSVCEEEKGFEVKRHLTLEIIRVAAPGTTFVLSDELKKKKY